MNTLDAVTMNMLAKARGSRMRVFDWDHAAEIIRDRKLTDASAGLKLDLANTIGRILMDGIPVQDDDAYLASCWAVPVLCVWNFEAGCWDQIDCWKHQEETPGWGAKTRWPDSALYILGFAREDVKSYDSYDDTLYDIEEEEIAHE